MTTRLPSFAVLNLLVRHPVRTSAVDDAGSGPLVPILPDRSTGDAAMFRSDEWLSTVLVSYVGTVSLDVVIKYLINVLWQVNDSL